MTLSLVDHYEDLLCNPFYVSYGQIYEGVTSQIEPSIQAFFESIQYADTWYAVFNNHSNLYAYAIHIKYSNFPSNLLDDILSVSGLYRTQNLSFMFYIANWFDWTPGSLFLFQR